MHVAVRPARSSFIERWIRPGLDAHWIKPELNGAGVNPRGASRSVRDTAVNLRFRHGHSRRRMVSTKPVIVSAATYARGAGLALTHQD